MSALPPYSDVTITPSVVGTNTNFTFSPAFLKLTPSSPKGYFTFSSTAAATATGSAQYTFGLTGTNAIAFTIPSTVTVQMTTDTTNTANALPTLNVTADPTDTSLPTTKIIDFSLTGVPQATIYYVVTLQNQAITDPIALQTVASTLPSYNASSANQAQYATTFYVASSKTFFILNNLYPNTAYTVSAVAITQTNKTSGITFFNFVTGSNGAPLQRWLFNYTTYPTVSQRQAVLCTITQTLAVPAFNVRDVHGEICGNSSGAFYSTANTSNWMGVYFYPLAVNLDTTMTTTNLNNVLNGTTTVWGTFQNNVNLALSGSAPNKVIQDLIYIPRQSPNISIPSSIPQSQIGATSINVTLSTVNETGFLFIALCSNTSTAPTALQMKAAAANSSSISGLVSLQVIYYYQGTTPSNSFTGLNAATSYNVYIAAGNNDPSFLQNFTTVTSIPVTTLGGTSTTGNAIGVMVSMMAVFASVISLMFF